MQDCMDIMRVEARDQAAGVLSRHAFDGDAAFAPRGVSPAHLAPRWTVDQPGVTAVIPGALTAQQARDNATVDELGPLDAAVRTRIAELYDRRIRPSVHTRW
jgi:aryl-alcohol dehydrogenase-like predicted oxidoreductase